MTDRARERFVVLLLAAMALGLSLFDARRDSATADEPIHVAAGVAQVRSGTWLVNVEHPPLAKHLFGLGAIAATGVEAPRLVYADFFRSARRWLFAPRPGVATDGVLLAARAVASLLFAALVVAAYDAVGGGLAGLAASALVLGNTALFPHGHLATTDVPLTLFVVLLAGALRRLDGAPKLPVALLAVAWLAAALATKYSAVLLLPLTALAPLLGARRSGEGRRRLLFAAAIPATAVLLLAVGLSWSVRREAPGTLEILGRVYGMSPGDMALLEKVEGANSGLARWGFGLLFNLRQAETGRLTFFDGPTLHPSALYHVVALVLKSPGPWLLAVAAGAVLALRHGGPRLARVFFAGALLLLVGSLPGPRIGVRHVFPVAALLTLAAAVALAPQVARLPQLARAGLLFLALSPLAFDRTIGADGVAGRIVGRPILADSNLDWGQDLLRLRDLLARRGIAPSDVAIAYFGGDLPRLRIPGVSDLLEEDSEPRRYLAVSRHLLLLGEEAVLVPDSRLRAVAALARARAPDSRRVARAGDSIELFDLVGVTPSP